MKNIKTILKYLWHLFILSIIVSVVIVMYKNMGLISKFDFGAGAYYYTDIPNFEKYINNSIFKTKFSIWFLITLFLIWGVFVYKLWCYIDRKIEKDK
mgnify:FL=1